MNKISAGLQGMRLCKSEVKHSSQQGFLPVVQTACSANHTTSDGLIIQLCPFFLFSSLPTEVQAWKSLLPHKGKEAECHNSSCQTLGVPCSQPHLQPRTAAQGLAAQPCRRARAAWGKGKRNTVLRRKTWLKEQ